MSDTKDTNVATFLQKLGNIKAEYVSAFLPSKKTTLKLKPLNLRQQKDIISSVADGVAGMISFTRILNNAIIDATGDETVKIQDRAPLTIALRASALGDTYKDGEKTISLVQILNTYKTYTPEFKDEDVVTHNGITVNVSIPTLKEENLTIKKLEEEIKRNGEKNNTKNLGSIYIYEIIKYIQSIKIDDIEVDYTSLKVKEKIEIIENLPLILNKKIINFIESIRKEEREILTVDDVTVEINPSFFDAE